MGAYYWESTVTCPFLSNQLKERIIEMNPTSVSHTDPDKSDGSTNYTHLAVDGVRSPNTTQRNWRQNPPKKTLNGRKTFTESIICVNRTQCTVHGSPRLFCYVPVQVQPVAGDVQAHADLEEEGVGGVKQS